MKFAIVLAILSAYGDVRHELMTRYPDWQRASDSPAFAKTLNRAWAAVGESAAAYLKAHPGANAKEIAAAVEQLNGGKCAEKDEACNAYELTADALPLGDGVFVVSAAYFYSGTFFVIDRTGVRWNVKDIAAKHLAKRDQIGYWAWIGFGWGDGPLIPRLGALAPTRGGHPRFYVHATTGTMIGGTFSQQISVWEWNGRAATPQFIKPYWISFETGAVTLDGDVLRIPIKGNFKTFYSCGQCVEPEVIWSLQITPDGVRDLGKKHVVPELQRVDELFDRIVHGRSTKDIASPRVVAALHKFFNGELDMMGKWSVKGNVLEFEADALECQPLHFTFERRAAGIYFTEVTCSRAQASCRSALPAARSSSARSSPTSAPRRSRG